MLVLVSAGIESIIFSVAGAELCLDFGGEEHQEHPNV